MKVIPLHQPKKEKIWIRVSPTLMLHKPTGTFYARKSRTGKGEFFKSTGIKNLKGRAQAKADDMIGEWLGIKGKREKRKRVGPVCDDLLAVLENEFLDGKRRRGTWEHDRYALPIIKKYFGDIYIDELDEGHWEAWIDETGRSLNVQLFDYAKYLSKLLNYALLKKYISRKPRIRNPDKQTKVGVVYENKTIQLMIEHSEPLLMDMILLAAENPLRPHEVRELKWEMVHFSNDTVVLCLPANFTKTKEARELQISPQAAQMLIRRKREAAKGTPYVFCSPKEPHQPVNKVYLSRMWRRMLKAAKLRDGLKFHWLRHSFYSKALLDARIPIQLVSEAGGTSITTLQKRYLHSDAKRTAAVSGAVSLNLGKMISEKSVKVGDK